MRPMRCGINGVVICCLLAAGGNTALAGPPKIGEPSPFVQWLAPLNPAHWQLPKWSWPGRQPASPPVLRRKSDGIWSGLTTAVGKGWAKTKRTLDPDQWKTQPQRSRSTGGEVQQAGFWSGLWPQQDEPKKIETPSDFLSQPVPY